MSDKHELEIAFGVSPSKAGAKGDDMKSDVDTSDGIDKACEEFFEALGVKPKDEDAAKEALLALVDLRIAHSEEDEGKDDKKEGDSEEDED